MISSITVAIDHVVCVILFVWIRGIYACMIFTSHISGKKLIPCYGFLTFMSIYIQSLMIFEFGLCTTKCLHRSMMIDSMKLSINFNVWMEMAAVVAAANYIWDWVMWACHVGSFHGSCPHGTAQAGALRYGHLLQCLPIKPAAPCQHLAWCAVAGGIGQSGWVGVVGQRSGQPSIFSRGDRSPKCQQSCNTSMACLLPGPSKNESKANSG